MKQLSLFIGVMLFSCLASAQNYDESKVGSYTLPKILESNNGSKINTVKDWESERRGEIISLFEEHVYGQMPKKFEQIDFKLKNENKRAMGGKAHLKEIEIKVTNNGESVLINLLLFIPLNLKKPAPAFVLINNRPHSNTSPTRETVSGFWPAEDVIAAGYAIAAFHVSDAAPDDKNTYQNGVLRLYPEQLKADNGMKAIGAWAWAASRVMDYFETDKDIDAKKVGIVGHSRGGKASLWAAAQDQRFAMCFTNNSGSTGAALSKRWFGETVAIINKSFPHWFNNNYKKFNDNEKELPVDQHMLIASIAPRPVYATNASEDLWADPTGTFLAMKEAEPVYALYQLKSRLPDNPPPLDTPFLKPPLGYHNRTGKHDLTPYDWKQFVSFANYYYQNPTKK
ncbi:acetylxylan esterase [Dyadobacter sp. CY312]|uniref:glucuronyl esterase domain-containing protein n=1 Tax=Dyadobacter sp. CY312 TaxID=2907303 RepID=UPI001F3F293C|nr:acetylxylan esterase [Dyadobacter sp. CY312]MCE7041414.1 acetylxylan esterase [Dyadobacter sp. CY312]